MKTLSIFVVLFLTACSTVVAPETGQVYRSPEFDYELEYSDDWELNDENSAEVSWDLDSQLTQNTNVHEAYLRIDVRDSEDLDSCLSSEVSDPAPALRSDFTSEDVETLNGISFYKASGSEGAAGTAYNVRYARSYHLGRCFTLEEHLNDSDLSLYEGSSVVDATDATWDRLEDLRKNFHFLESEWVYPVENFETGITLKKFGTYITPETSPVQPERFSGYHTGVDVEVAEGFGDVPVYSIGEGTVVTVQEVDGYGGVVVVRYDFNGETVLGLYGHLDLKSVTVQTGETVEPGEQLAYLGEAYSDETDGERQHLHFALIRGETVDFKGYVQNASELSAWLDPQQFFDQTL